MNEHVAVIIGASGLIGSHLVEQILHDKYFNSVRLLVRKRVAIIHPKLQQEIVDFNDINDYTQKLGEGYIIFCCIGTTQKKVKGNKAEYEKIDYDIPVNAAQVGIKHGYKKYLIVSSVGANPSASNFYLRLKGKTEKAIKQFDFDAISIVRPSMLLGKRKEKRLGEKIGQMIMQRLAFIFIGNLNKYHPIEAKYVAKAMIEQSKNNKGGIHILQYKEMMNLIT